MHNFKAFFQPLCQFESRLFKALPCYKNILALINQHQLAIHALDDIASRGKSTMGWFYSCKLHLLMNQEGEIVNSDLSNGHIADIKKVEDLVDGLSATVYGDRGYISQSLKETLKGKNIDLITYPRKKYESHFIPIF